MGLYYWHSMQTYEWKQWKIYRIVKCLRSKQLKNYYLNQLLSWNFDRYTVGKVWNYWGNLGTFGKVVYTIQFCKTISVIDWYSSPWTKRHEYLGVLFCDD